MARGSFFECALAVLVAGGIASPLGVAPSAAGAADDRVDLTACLAPGSATGDSRVFDTNRGTTLTETVLAVDGWKGADGWGATVEAQLGDHVPTVRQTFVRPGRKLLLGDLSVGDLDIQVGAPEKWLPLDAEPGRSYRARVKGKALRGGQKVGRAVVTQSWEIVGFEPLVTPVASYGDTVHIAASRNVDVNPTNGELPFGQKSDVELWCVDGVGVVAASYSFRFYENGTLVGDVANLDSWLVSATVDGVAMN